MLMSQHAALLASRRKADALFNLTLDQLQEILGCVGRTVISRSLKKLVVVQI